ncbi:MAG: RecQ family ATP-dependent DNA helicase, partial [Nakamurella sp.]
MNIDSLARDVLDIALTESQRTALTAITSGHDVLAVLPTGSGKSAIYQLGGLALGGLTVVISPLIALQRDQLRSLERHRQARVAMLNSTQKLAERAAALAALDSGALDFLLLGPEQLANVETHHALRATTRPITMLAVDEAHLVSEWGHDFRPEYLRLGDTIAGLGHPLIVGLTATAAPPVQTEITRELGMRSPVVVVADFDRPNIALSVRRAHTYASEELAVVDRVVEVVVAHETPALVYAPSHPRCEDIAARLQRTDLRAAAYHAGLSTRRRAEVQDGFFAGRLDVVAATSAFGMGIDKPDVRTVVHAGVPSSVDEYYQEIGRSGRDGQPASAVLVYDERTLRIPRLFAARTRIPPAAVQAVVSALGG